MGPTSHPRRPEFVPCRSGSALISDSRERLNCCTFPSLLSSCRMCGLPALHHNRLQGSFTGGLTFQYEKGKKKCRHKIELNAANRWSWYDCGYQGLTWLGSNRKISSAQQQHWGSRARGRAASHGTLWAVLLSLCCIICASLEQMFSFALAWVNLYSFWATIGQLLQDDYNASLVIYRSAASWLNSCVACQMLFTESWSECVAFRLLYPDDWYK